jgi:hypothetical protein
MARKFKILVKRSDGKFQKYIVTETTLRTKYSKSRLTKTDRAAFKQLKRKRIFYEKKPVEYTKWVRFQMGVEQKGVPLYAWFGFESKKGKVISDIEAFERATKRIDNIDQKEIKRARIRQAMNEEIRWLDATDQIVYDAEAYDAEEKPPKTEFFVYDGKSGKKLVWDGRYNAWAFRR